MLGILEPEVGGHLAATFLNLFGESGGAAGMAVKGGLEPVADAVDEINGAQRIGCRGDALLVAFLLQVDHCRPGGKDAPVNRIREGLACRVAVAGARRNERRNICGLLRNQTRGRQSEPGAEQQMGAMKRAEASGAD